MTPLPKLVILAGTSEAGKSSAGQYLSQLGAIRQKIRDILLTLSSGELVTHEGVATRTNFAPAQFLAALIDKARTLAPDDILVLESFIDADLAVQCRSSWTSRALIVFIDAPFGLRVSRLMVASGLSAEEARHTIKAKDERKRVGEQMGQWRSVSDIWIDNAGSLHEYRAALRQTLEVLGNETG